MRRGGADAKHTHTLASAVSNSMRHTQQHRRSVYARAAAPTAASECAPAQARSAHASQCCRSRSRGAVAHGSITNHIILRRLSRVCDARTFEIRFAAERRACVFHAARRSGCEAHTHVSERSIKLNAPHAAAPPQRIRTRRRPDRRKRVRARASTKCTCKPMLPFAQPRRRGPWQHHESHHPAPPVSCV